MTCVGSLSARGSIFVSKSRISNVRKNIRRDQHRESCPSEGSGVGQLALLSWPRTQAQTDGMREELETRGHQE